MSPRIVDSQTYRNFVLSAEPRFVIPRQLDTIFSHARGLQTFLSRGPHKVLHN